MVRDRVRVTFVCSTVYINVMSSHLESLHWYLEIREELRSWLC